MRDEESSVLDFYCGKVLNCNGYADLLYKFDVAEITYENFLSNCQRYLSVLDPVSLSYYLYRVGVIHRRRGDIQRSCAYFKAAHHQNGANSKIIALLAQAHFELRDYEQSRFFAKQSISLANPQVGKPNYMAYFTLFNAYKKLDKLDKAYHTLSSLEEVAPKVGFVRERLNLLKEKRF